MYLYNENLEELAIRKLKRFTIGNLSTFKNFSWSSFYNLLISSTFGYYFVILSLINRLNPLSIDFSTTCLQFTNNYLS